jgi:hypothetical protein
MRLRRLGYLRVQASQQDRCTAYWRVQASLPARHRRLRNPEPEGKDLLALTEIAPKRLYLRGHYSGFDGDGLR